ncbi:asparaginase [Gudongella sp. DL1XJH-153]|uniref:asparaginase n=1 Tax=Gudongella sp. DL1XJH-153 TaxID=3409804 RepID=UPI003BB6EA05
MSEILLHVTRGGRVENIHRGDIAVVDYKGKIIASFGDPYKRTFLRSSAKPLQTLVVIETGAEKEYGITKKELAVMCASHYAEDFHIDAVSSVLRKLDLGEDDLLCGHSYSLNDKVTRQLIRDGRKARKIFNTCSGKHSGMLAVSRKLDLPLDTYNMLQHPLQQMTLDTIAEVCEMDRDDIGVGIDGCGVPVVEMPLYNMALSYAKLVHSSVFDEKRKAAADLVVESMMEYPEMVAGTGGFCTELMKNTNGKLMGKLGADGVYCIGMVEQGVGIAIKIENGNYNVISSAVMDILKQMEYLDQEDMSALKSFHIIDNINTLKEKVGEIKPVFELDMKV